MTHIDPSTGSGQAGSPPPIASGASTFCPTRRMANTRIANKKELLFAFRLFAIHLVLSALHVRTLLAWAREARRPSIQPLRPFDLAQDKINSGRVKPITNWT